MSVKCRSLFLALHRTILGRQFFKSVLSETRAAGTVAGLQLVERCGRQQFHHDWTATLKHRIHRLATLQSHHGLHSEAGDSTKDEDYPPLPDYSSVSRPEKEVFIIRAKGLPWSCTADDLMHFFSECRVRDGVKGIHLTVNRDGKPNGQAFIELENEEDVSKALEKHRQYLGRRYIEVSEVTNSDAEAILKKTIQLPAKDGVVRLRGLPYSCTETDILLFFAGLDVAEDGVTLTTDYRGRKTGEAYVQFLTQEQADQALTKDRELIGNRYIEVFPSNRNEIGGRRKAEAVEDGRVSRPSQPDRAVVQPREPRQTDRHEASPMSSHHFVHMRGLPYSATGQDIAQFFYPLALSKILLEFGPDGKATGEGEVYFTSHEDAIAAMTRDKAHMQERYIELFLNSAGPTEGE
ncbi:G-rich sequence factor 1 isoform X4 [Esox lucius]|uniref:RRM domain-containing protein n=1 Tax=Esox lucius TaxID=8010 RepID=A0A3P8Y579_ESOLU|nr:G-rich sequence factor 1 isoform X4 [Esox lucius]